MLLGVLHKFQQPPTAKVHSTYPHFFGLSKACQAGQLAWTCGSSSKVHYLKLNYLVANLHISKLGRFESSDTFFRHISSMHMNQLKVGNPQKHARIFCPFQKLSRTLCIAKTEPKTNSWLKFAFFHLTKRPKVNFFFKKITIYLLDISKKANFSQK